MSEGYYSIFDSDIPITDDLWGIAIMRDASIKKHLEHAFIVVEGRSSTGGVIFRRYDYVLDSKSPSKRTATIQIKEFSPINPKDFFFEGLLQNADVYSYSCSISKEQAEKLHTDIKEDEKKKLIFVTPPEITWKDKLILGSLGSIGLHGWSTCNGCLNYEDEHIHYTPYEWARKRVVFIEDRNSERLCHIYPGTFKQFMEKSSKTYLSKKQVSHCCIF